MIHTTPPRIAAQALAPHEGQNVEVIVDAFNNPRTAAKHEAQIGRLMLKMVKRAPKETSREPDTARRKHTFDFCMDQWRTTAEIAEHINAHVETVRKLVKAMHEAGSLERKQRPYIPHVEYLYRSRNNLKEANKDRMNAARKREQAIIDFCSDWRSCREVSERMGFTMSGMRNKLRRMIQAGAIQRRGQNGNVEYRRTV